MWADNLYAVAMRHAATQCGSEEALAEHLGVPADDVRRWSAGEGPPPSPGKVLIALLLSVQKPRASGNRKRRQKR